MEAHAFGALVTQALRGFDDGEKAGCRRLLIAAAETGWCANSPYSTSSGSNASTTASRARDQLWNRWGRKFTSTGVSLRQIAEILTACAQCTPDQLQTYLALIDPSRSQTSTQKAS